MVSGAHESSRRMLSPHRSRSDSAGRIRMTSESREQSCARKFIPFDGLISAGYADWLRARPLFNSHALRRSSRRAST
jgi:hypothetical protein